MKSNVRLRCRDGKLIRHTCQSYEKSWDVTTPLISNLVIEGVEPPAQPPDHLTTCTTCMTGGQVVWAGGTPPQPLTKSQIWQIPRKIKGTKAKYKGYSKSAKMARLSKQVVRWSGGSQPSIFHPGGQMVRWFGRGGTPPTTQNSDYLAPACPIFKKRGLHFHTVRYSYTPPHHF